MKILFIPNWNVSYLEEDDCKMTNKAVEHLE